MALTWRRCLNSPTMPVQAPTPDPKLTDRGYWIDLRRSLCKLELWTFESPRKNFASEDITNRRTVKTGGVGFCSGMGACTGQYGRCRSRSKFVVVVRRISPNQKNPKKATIVSVHNNADPMRICFGLRPLLSVLALPVMFAILAWRHFLVRYLRCIKIKAWLGDHWEDITEVYYWSAAASDGS